MAMPMVRWLGGDFWSGVAGVLLYVLVSCGLL